MVFTHRQQPSIFDTFKKASMRHMIRREIMAGVDEFKDMIPLTASRPIDRLKCCIDSELQHLTHQYFGECDNSFKLEVLRKSDNSYQVIVVMKYTSINRTIRESVVVHADW